MKQGGVNLKYSILGFGTLLLLHKYYSDTHKHVTTGRQKHRSNNVIALGLDWLFDDEQVEAVEDNKQPEFENIIFQRSTLYQLRQLNVVILDKNKQLNEERAERLNTSEVDQKEVDIKIIEDSHGKLRPKFSFERDDKNYSSQDWIKSNIRFALPKESERFNYSDFNY